MQSNQDINPKGFNREAESKYKYSMPKQWDSDWRNKSESCPEPLKYFPRLF